MNREEEIDTLKDLIEAGEYILKENQRKLKEETAVNPEDGLTEFQLNVLLYNNEFLHYQNIRYKYELDRLEGV